MIAALSLVACASSKTSEVRRLQAQAAFETGVKAFQDKEPHVAFRALQEAVRLDNTVPIYHDTLGLLLNELSRPDLAAAEFRRAVELDPHYGDAHFHLGVALAETGRWDEAAKAYRRALDEATLTVPHLAHQSMGLALYHLKRYPEAEGHLRFALSLDPQMEAAYYNLGLLFVAENRKEDAKVAFRRVRELAPQSPFGQAAGERLKALGEGG